MKIASIGVPLERIVRATTVDALRASLTPPGNGEYATKVGSRQLRGVDQDWRALESGPEKLAESGLPGSADVPT